MGYIEELRDIIGHRRINLCGSVVIIENARGQFLMQERKHPIGKWGLPGGLMELGESAEDTARREVFEETGLTLGGLCLLGVYSGEGYLCIAENGDEFYSIVIAYTANEFTGNLGVNDNESISLCWIDRDKLPDDIAGTHKDIISDYLGKAKK